jgi:cold shock CspA family protein
VRVHVSAVERDGMPALDPGQSLSYERQAGAASADNLRAA